MVYLASATRKRNESYLELFLPSGIGNKQHRKENTGNGLILSRIVGPSSPVLSALIGSSRFPRSAVAFFHCPLQRPLVFLA